MPRKLFSIFLSVLSPAHSAEKNPTQNPMSSPASQSTEFTLLFVELCFFGNSALPEVFRSSYDFHLQLYDLQSPDNFCIDKRWRNTELFKYNKIYENKRI